MHKSWEDQEYRAICGVCCERFTFKAGFLSAISFSEKLLCPEDCTRDPGDGHYHTQDSVILQYSVILSGACPQGHSREDVRAAWEAGFPALATASTPS